MEPPPDDTLMWCLERCLDDPAVPYQVVLGLAQTVTATRTLPDRLKCRLVLRDVEQEAAANRVSQRTVSALQQLAALAEGLRGEGVEEADLLACGEQFLLAVGAEAAWGGGSAGAARAGGRSAAGGGWRLAAAAQPPRNPTLGQP